MQAAHDGGTDHATRPGMPVAAYIKTRERTPLEIWLDPLIGSIRKSLRET
jgi:hypothetical protein